MEKPMPSDYSLAQDEGSLIMPNKFEAWKQGLTIEDFDIRNFVNRVDCINCPAKTYCDDHHGYCKDIFKEWGEQDAER